MGCQNLRAIFWRIGGNAGDHQNYLGDISFVSDSNRFENHNWNFSLCPALVILVGRIQPHSQRPQTAPLLICGFPGPDSIYALFDLDRGNGGSLEIQPPGWMPIITSIRGNNNPASPILYIKQRRSPRSTSLSSNRSQEENRHSNGGAYQSSRHSI